MDFIHKYKSPLGTIVIASDGEALTGLWFEGQKYFASTLDTDNTEGSLPVFTEADKWLDVYFSGSDPGFIPKISMRGTDFRKSVWEMLLKIPFGETLTYGQIAAKLAEAKGTRRMSARAVGNAVGHNPISLIVPCHRVVGSDGSLTGYAGGIDRKAALLKMESAGCEPRMEASYRDD